MPYLARMLVFALPLLILPGVVFHYETTPKVALLALVTALALAQRRAIVESITELFQRRAGRWLTILALAQIAWFGLATAVSTRPWFSLFGANWRRMGLVTVISLVVFILLAAAQFAKTPDEIRAVLRAFSFAAIIASIYGIAQYFDVDPFQPAAAYHAQAGDSTITRPPGTLGHADYFGWWLAIAFFCGLAVERTEKDRWRMVGRAALILSAIALVLSGTRSAMLGVLAGLIYLGLRLPKLRRPGARQLSIAALALALILGFVFSPPGTRLRARVRWSADEPLGGARPLLWKDSLSMTAARSLAGFGPETFPADFPRYQSEKLAQLFPDFYHESPHNSALDALTSMGVPGLFLAFAWIALGAWCASRPGLRDSPLAGPLTAALLASCVTSVFTAVTLTPLFATGIVLSMLVAMMPRENAHPAVNIGSKAVPAVTYVLSFGLALWAVALFAFDFNLSRFEHANGIDVAPAWQSMNRSRLPGAGEDLYCSRKLLTICPTIVNVAPRQECWRTAVEAADRATASNDNPPNAWYNRALVAATHGDRDQVAKSLRMASTLAPNWFKPHWSLARMLALDGETTEARKEAQRAAFLDAGKDAAVTQTLKQLSTPGS